MRHLRIALCTGIGGDAFCLFFDAATKEVTAILGCGAAPAALTLEARAASLQERASQSAATDVHCLLMMH